MANTKIPAELSSTPSIVDNGNATAITIDSSEDVTVNNGTLTSSGANGADNQGFHITDTGYSKTHKLYGDNSLHIQADSGQSILMKPNASEIARFTSDGLTFNGDTATANALNDYEEGTWTPATTSSVGITTYSATYTKIGDVVMYRCYVQFGVTSSGDSAVINGLPFTNVGSNVWCAGSVWENNAKQPYPLVQDGGESTIQLRKSANGAHHPYSDFSNTQVIVTGTYKTTQ